MKIIKRNGSEVDFDYIKIVTAINKASQEVVDIERIDVLTAEEIALTIQDYYEHSKITATVEDVQDKVEMALMRKGYFKLAQVYVKYRYKRELVRKSNSTEEKIMSMINLSNEEIKQENSNKNPTIVSTQRDYMAGEVSKDLTRKFFLDEKLVKAHDDGLIHFHDMDYFAQHMYNCCLINLDDMLQNGTVISGTKIEKPHSFATACNVATQIMAQVASCQYGGQTITLSHLAPFVDVSRKKIAQEVMEELTLDNYLFKADDELDADDQDYIDNVIEMRLRREVKRGVQTIQYQINTLQTTNGQAPFCTVFMYLNEVEDEQTRADLAMIIEEMLNQRYQGTKNEQGVWITPAFPKLIYVLEENNITENSKYWYLTKLAAKCTARRLVPDYISEKKMKELKGACYPSMGCRSFLSPDPTHPNKFYGRFNKGVVTVNLIDAACSAAGADYNKDLDSFWKIFDERLEMCYDALITRYERLKGTVTDVAPILWQNGAIARLKKGEKIDDLLIGGYSSISLGYAGLWETIIELIGKKPTTPEGTKLGLAIMQHMNDKCKEWDKRINLGFAIYGSPIESTTYKFAKCLQKRFGIIKDVTDKNYITNSYHVKVTEPINAFDKLAFESQFQSLSGGGAISYVEIPNMENNLDGVLAVIKFIYDNIMYAELNTKSDYCQKCGFSGEIQIVEENGKLIWQCPCCGNKDQNFLNVARRTCGYIGSNFWNQGRTQEIKERYVHLGNGK